VRSRSPKGEPVIPDDLPDRDKGHLEEAIGLASRLGALNHYELLGVERTASVKMLRHTFRKLARKYHVDRFSRYALNQATMAKVQAVFIALNRAHETLSDAHERQEYDISLEFIKSAEQRTGKKADPQDKNARLQDVLRAEKLVQVALAQLARGDAATALERLKQALLVTPDDPNAVAGMAYAEYLVSQSQGASKSIATRSYEVLMGVMGANPNLPEPHLYAGRILRDRGDYEQAIASFRQALKLNPHLSQATSELRYAMKRKEETATGLKGLFGRKK